MKKKHLVILSITLIIILLFFDQWLKFWVKTNMTIGESFSILGNSVIIHFVENDGMAFGLSFGENAGKIILSVARIIIVGFIIFYMSKRIKIGEIKVISLLVFSFIIAGALGNIIDCFFYGVMFNSSTYFDVATFMPAEGGYAPILMGKVVDMFEINLFRIPAWFPYFGGLNFFPAIFNIADSCVTIGLFMLVIWNKSIFPSIKKHENN